MTPSGQAHRSAADVGRQCIDAAIARLASIRHPHLVPHAAITAEAPLVAQPGTAWVRQARSRLVRQGMDDVEAGNLVAYAAGLHPVSGGWSNREVTRLVALRARVACTPLAY